MKLKKEIDFKEKEIHSSVVKIQAMKCEVKAQCTEITKLKKEIKYSATIENTNDAVIAANEIIENLLTSVMREKDEDYYYYSINQELLSQRDSLQQEVNQLRTELEKKGEESLEVKKEIKTLKKQVAEYETRLESVLAEYDIKDRTLINLNQYVDDLKLVIESLEKELVEKTKQSMKTPRDGISEELISKKSKKYKEKKMDSPEKEARTTKKQ